MNWLDHTDPLVFQPFQKEERMPKVEGMGTDAPTVTNEKGASQSHLPYRFDLFDGPAMFKMAEVLSVGADKYGVDNWRGIPVSDHLNHMIAHAYAWLSGDTSDDHLSHVLCRAMFAQAVDISDSRLADGLPIGPETPVGSCHYCELLLYLCKEPAEGKHDSTFHDGDGTHWCPARNYAKPHKLESTATPVAGSGDPPR